MLDKTRFNLLFPKPLAQYCSVIASVSGTAEDVGAGMTGK